MVDFAKWLNRPVPPPTTVPHLLIGVTGHRPPKVGGYDRDNPLRQWLRGQMRSVVEQIAARPPRDNSNANYIDSYLRRVEWKPGVDWRSLPVIGISGVALGVDQDFCGVLARMSPRVPYIAAVPFPGQESRWPLPSRKVYAAVFEHAAGVVYVSATKPLDDEAIVASASSRMLSTLVTTPSVGSRCAVSYLSTGRRRSCSRSGR